MHGIPPSRHLHLFLREKRGHVTMTSRAAMSDPDRVTVYCNFFIRGLGFFRGLGV